VERPSLALAACRFPHTRIPFRCSGGHHCAFFHLCRLIHTGPTCTSALKRCTGACVLASFHRSTWAHFCHTCLPFRCSGRLCCAFFQSGGSIYGGPTHTSALRRCARARVLASFHRSAWVRVCTTFHRRSKVCICSAICSNRFLGGNNEGKCVCTCAFSPGAPLDLVEMSWVFFSLSKCFMFVLLTSHHPRSLYFLSMKVLTGLPKYWSPSFFDAWEV